MIARRQFGSSNGVRNEYGFREGGRQGENELRLNAPVSREPIDRPGVGVVIVGFHGTVVGMSSRVGVRQPSGVLVVRVARVRMLERRLRE